MVEWTYVDARERSCESCLPRRTGTPGLANHAAVRTDLLALAPCAFEAPPRLTIVAIQRDERPGIEQKRHAARPRFGLRPRRTTIALRRSLRRCASSSASVNLPNSVS